MGREVLGLEGEAVLHTMSIGMTYRHIDIRTQNHIQTQIYTLRVDLKIVLAECGSTVV